MRTIPIRWTKLGALLGVMLLALVGVLVLISRRGSGWVSNPAKPRSSPLYDTVLGPARPPRALEPFDPRSITLGTNGREVSIEVAQSKHSAELDRVYGYSIYRAGSDQRAVFPGGSVRLSRMGVCYGPFPGDGARRDTVRLPARFFDAKGGPVKGEQLEELVPREWNRSLDFRGDFPEVRFSFITEGLSETKLLNLQIFDARTHRSLLPGGYSWSDGERGRFWVGSRVKLWHQAPILLVVTLAHGPVTTTKLEATVGTVAKHDQGELDLVAILEHTDSGWSSSSSGDGTERLTLRLVDAETPKGRAQTAYVWYGLPQASPIPLALEYLDENGKVLAGGGSGSSGRFLLGGIPESAGKVAAIRVRSFPHIRRLVFYLPEVPGLPEENRGVDNLFDVRIPQLRIKEEWRFREFLSGATQLESETWRWPDAPRGFFPLTRTNVTVREIAAEYEASLGGKYRLRVGPDGEHLFLEPPVYLRWLNQAEEFLKRHF